jgi:Tfp pilus assembly PilM family ATPase
MVHLEDKEQAGDFVWSFIGNPLVSRITMALFGSPRAFLGLDIGPTSIQLVEVVDRGRRLELATYAQAPRPADTSLRATAEYVARMLDKAQVSADRVAMSLPSSRTFSAALTLPNIQPAQLESIIHFRARDLIPMALADVTLSWKEQQRVPGTIDIYLTAVPKRLERWYQGLANQLSLEVEALEPEVFSLIRAHSPDSARAKLFCNIGDRQTTLHRVVDNSPVASYTITFNAESAHEADGAAARRLAAAARQFAGSDQGAKAILAGERALTPGVAEALQAALAVELEVSNPWHDLAYPAELEVALTELGPSLATAIGLARRRVPHRM